MPVFVDSSLSSVSVEEVAEKDEGRRKVSTKRRRRRLAKKTKIRERRAPGGDQARSAKKEGPQSGPSSIYQQSTPQLSTNQRFGLGFLFGGIAGEEAGGRRGFGFVG